MSYTMSYTENDLKPGMLQRACIRCNSRKEVHRIVPFLLSLGYKMPGLQISADYFWFNKGTGHNVCIDISNVELTATSVWYYKVHKYQIILSIDVITEKEVYYEPY